MLSARGKEKTTAGAMVCKIIFKEKGQTMIGKSLVRLFANFGPAPRGQN
jgi:hypothetical protein